MNRITALVIGAALTAAIFTLRSTGPDVAVAEAQATRPLLGDPGAIADVAEKVLPSVVNIATTRMVNTTSSPYGGDPFEEFFGRRRGRGGEYQQHGGGSGVIVSSRGYILTNNHVIDGSKEIKVSLSDGRELDATVVGTDPKSDLAVLKVKGKVTGLTPLAMGDSSRLRLGEVVIAIGNPFGMGQTVTMGIVSAKGRANMGIVDYEDFIQTDAAINPGNSGGALVNMRGELVGINTAILSRTGGYQGIGFAIPTDMARPIMNSLIKSGKVVRGWLGVSIQDLTRELSETLGIGADRGVLIGGVVNGSPAARAGLRRGDVVVSVGGRATNKAVHLRNAVAAAGVGKPVAVEIIRGGKRQSVQVTLGEQPTDDVVAAAGAAPREEAGAGATRLGLQLAPLNRITRQRFDIGREVSHGVVVTGVARGGVGETLGLQAGDVILQVNRTVVKSAGQLEAAYRKAGKKLALLIHRDGNTVYVVVTK